MRKAIMAIFVITLLSGLQTLAYADTNQVSGVWSASFSNGYTNIPWILYQNETSVTGHYITGTADGTYGFFSGTISGSVLSLSRNTGLATIQFYELNILSNTEMSGRYWNEGAVPGSGTMTLSRTEQFPLMVTINGDGTVTSDVGNLSWDGNIGLSTYAPNTIVNLTAKPGNGSSFTGWTGACTGIAPCTITMNQAQNTTAIFSPMLYVSFVGDGSGSVHSSPLTDISCIKGESSGCSAPFAANSIITLIPNSDSSTSIFGGWSNACFVEPCEITMNSSKTAIASFILAPKLKLDLNATSGYDTFNAAYNNASSTIFGMNTLLTGDWLLDANKDIVLTGGYMADYKIRTGFTTLKGKLTIKNGSLRVDRLIIGI